MFQSVDDSSCPGTFICCFVSVLFPVWMCIELGKSNLLLAFRDNRFTFMIGVYGLILYR